MEQFNQMFLFEQGVGGVVQFPKDFLRKAYELVRKNGGVCIADEVFICFCVVYSLFNK
jgi:4-aminobutyrate aminotransferase-like enzyme